eukprot:TRINITY_DN5359_c0_g2_i1.p1 TRINITY_DN5359_c0_g2~~TRINITY_DN5359_c0_g2_i1.p1  ORF type:complete len:1237 (+),score=127.96 TRINITY_DN5359_c0_g2_i1:32-3742(+)
MSTDQIVAKTYLARNATLLTSESHGSLRKLTRFSKFSSTRGVTRNLELELNDSVLCTKWLSSRKQQLYKSLVTESIQQNVWVATANGWPMEATTVSEAVASLSKDLRRSDERCGEPSVIMVLISEVFDPKEVLAAVQEQFPFTTNIHGATTCLGVTTEAGFNSTANQAEDCPLAIGLWAMFDPLGSYVTVGLPPAPVKGKPCTNCSDFFEMPEESPTASAWKLRSTASAETEHAVYLTRLDVAYRKLRSQAQKVLVIDRGDDDDQIGDEPLSEHLVIWMTSLPGMEEAALDALYSWGRSRFGRSIPIVGGTAADSSIGGKWFCFCRSGDFDVVFGGGEPEGMVITLMACSVKTHTLFMHPFTPINEFRAKVTSCGLTEDQEGSEGRVILKLQDVDNVEHPAGSLYRTWCNEHIQENIMPAPKVADGPNSFDATILKNSTLCPLGIPVANEGDDSFDYRMLHPSGIYYNTGHDGKPVRDGAHLKTFAGVVAGQTEVVLFKARRGDLLHRITKMREQLVVQLDKGAICGSSGSGTTAGSPDALRARIAGGLMTYCAGCLMGLRDGKDGLEQTRRLGSGLQKVFSGRPFMSMHPFGEQGFFHSKQRSMQANLMWSALIFTRDPCFEVDESGSLSDVVTELLSKSPSNNRKCEVSRAIHELLIGGADVNWRHIANFVDTALVSVDLLRALTLCSSEPFKFSMHAAGTFVWLATNRPLKSLIYSDAAKWHKAFCADFLAAASVRQISLGKVLEHSVLCCAVSKSSQIDAKFIVASQTFQDIIHDMWVSGSEADTSLERMLGDRVGSGNWKWGPNKRYGANTASYICLLLTQFALSLSDVNHVYAWCAIVVWASGFLVMTAMAPDSGFFTRFSVVKNAVMVGALAVIPVASFHGRKVPNDLSCLAMLIHSLNISQQFVVHPTYGPLVIMVQRMMIDILFWLGAWIFCVAASFMIIQSLYLGQSPEFAGESFGMGSWNGATTILVNWVAGPQLLWTVPESVTATTPRMVLSQLIGTSDAVACDVVGLFVMCFVWLLCPLLMINLLIAMMASSYATVAQDSDLEWKWYRAAAVLVAREMPSLPVPFNLIVLVWALICWLYNKLGRMLVSLSLGLRPPAENTESRGRRFSSETEQHDVAAGAVEQIVLQLETQRSLEHLRGNVTMDMMDRVRLQMENLAERIHAVSISVHLTSEKLEKSRAKEGMLPNRIRSKSEDCSDEINNGLFVETSDVDCDMRTTVSEAHL